jgi:hypothetical protein
VGSFQCFHLGEGLAQASHDAITGNSAPGGDVGIGAGKGVNPLLRRGLPVSFG